MFRPSSAACMHRPQRRGVSRFKALLEGFFGARSTIWAILNLKSNTSDKAIIGRYGVATGGAVLADI